MRRSVSRLVAAGLVAGSIACHDSGLVIPNYNAPTVEQFAGDLQALQLMVTGLLALERDARPTLRRDVGVFGREALPYSPTNLPTITAFLFGMSGPDGPRLDPGGAATGNWSAQYRVMRNAIALARAGDASPLSDAEKRAIRGFAMTLRALSLLDVITTRDVIGAPVEIDDDPGALAPFVSRDSVYLFISALLDAARTELAGAGAKFPFVLSSGFAGFDTPASFLTFNRGLSARALAVRGSLGCGAPCYQQALTALGESFVSSPGSLSTGQQLDVGVYDVYDPASGSQNRLNFTADGSLFAHASIVAEAQSKADGTPDARVDRKVVKLATPVVVPATLGLPARYRFAIYPTAGSPLAIMRNEELILLRAEANIQTANLGAALVDLNTVRRVSGGLVPLASLGTPVAALNELLYNRRYSLLLEGQRWSDARRFGRLDQLPLDLPTHFVAKVVPPPKAECDARVAKPAGC